MLIRHISILSLFGIIYIPLILIYFKYLSSFSNSTSGFSIKNVLYIVYAFLGMAGLGISRNDLRAGNFEKITGVNVVLLAIICVIYLLAFINMARKKQLQRIKDYKIPIVAVLGYFFTFFIVSMVINFGLWERHVIPAFVLLFWIAIMMIYEMKEDKTMMILMRLL